jgi:hypothetical protein
MRFQAYSMIKLLIKKNILDAVELIQSVHFKWILWRTAKLKVVFLDIDNTLADTWPTLLPNADYLSENDRLRNLKPLSGSLSYVRENFGSEYVHIYLSHRNFIRHANTKRWLRKYANYNSSDSLYLVSSAHKKIRYFETAVQFCKFTSITVMDDLSYSHEHGEVEYYTEIVDVLAKMPIKYIGYKKILEINGNE